MGPRARNRPGTAIGSRKADVRISERASRGGFAMSEPRSLRWRCRRGMLELDVLLERFLDAGYLELDARGRETFDRLLDSEDDQLWDWMSGKVEATEQGIADIIKLIRAAS